jgi:hypothetical protein
MPVAATGDGDVINARRYYTRSKMKCRTFSLFSHTCLYGMRTLFITENIMASKDNKCKYADDHREEGEAEKSTVMSKKQRMSGDDNDSFSSSSSTDDLLSSSEVPSEEQTIRRARSDDGDATDSENNDSIRNDGDTSDDGSVRNDGGDDNDGSDHQFSDEAFN